MAYRTLHCDLKDPGFPPVLARVTPGPERRPADLYLSIPRVWVTVGPTLSDEVCWGGDWDGAPGEGPDRAIEIIDERRHPLRDGVHYWLHYFGPDRPPEVVVINADGRRDHATVPTKGWAPAGEPVPEPGSGDGTWYEMEMWESAAVVRTMRHGWY